ncbi:MAG TPA: hypothetical protein DDW52_25090 [Planctomycetaceae bacterium]|nr:hypothetical protein [Planctomycetaceae bacterium]
MKIKDVQIDGFGVWSELTVHSMPDTMTVFYGPNEAGKTTLMQFLRTMFYGFTPDRKTRYLPPVHGGKPGGAIRVTGPGGGYEICRRAQIDSTDSSGALTVTGNDGLSQGQHRLAMLLGQVDESIFTNVFAIGLRELQELSTLDDTAAADELYKLSSGLDRVSLVDVIRQLRDARQQVVSVSPDKGQMQRLLIQREKLKDEIDDSLASGKRWNELAALRKTQAQELEELKQRIDHWEVEAKGYEVALQVRPNWKKRFELQTELTQLGARLDIPDTTQERLDEINEQILERETRQDEIKNSRRALREQSRKLPLRPGILELSAKIEAAAEQTPWIGSLQKNIQRLESQIDQCRDQLVDDAKRLGIDEADQQALLDDRRMTNMPDLSRQAINQLAEPASEVRIWSGRLKQSRSTAETEQKEAQRLTQDLEEALQKRGTDDIAEALQQCGANISLLRKLQHIEEVLERQQDRRKELDGEAIDLTVDEALPVERSMLMAVLFVGGMFFIAWGVGKMNPFGVYPDSPADTTTGLMMVISGFFALFFGVMYSNVLDKGTVSELEDVEDQIDSVRKEIRKTEDERDELKRRLPPSNSSVEARIREVQGEIESLEALLPVQHNLQAVQQRYKVAKKRAAQADDALKTAKTNWSRTLSQLGLSESLSPKSIRIMAEGYDSLLQTRRRMQTLEEELETRQLELGAITQRITSLSNQVFAAKAASDVVASSNEDELEDLKSSSPVSADAEQFRPVRATGEMANSALEQLSKLSSLISSQEQYIGQRRELKEQDGNLAKQAASIQKSIDKLERTHSSLLAEVGCESEEQLAELLEQKAKHYEITEKISDLAERISAVVGGAVPYATVERLLENPGSDDLESRWEQIGQRTQQAEQRVEQLQLRQGELSQEMKTLASNTRLGEAKLELACVENQLKACAEHWRVLASTTSLLDRVCEVYETERQPETLREASAFLNQLTEGKYTRIWTPLGKNQLRIDNANGNALPLEVLSRGTREAVFIALRLSLAAAYARRGVTIPLVLDDVLVNFDSIRAEAAGRVLRDFAALGHQVVMFTCHEHIMKIFHSIGVEVRVLPRQGNPGVAEVYSPGEIIEEVTEPALPEPIVEPEESIEEVVETITEAVEELKEPDPELEPNKPTVKRIVVVEDEPDIDWLWYEKPATDSVEPPTTQWVEPDETSGGDEAPPDLWWTEDSASAAESRLRAS